MTFALIVSRRPPSGNKSPNRKFQAALRAEAQARFGSQPLLAGPLYARITWFHGEPTTQDVDNIAKNVLDGLKGTVFNDDLAIRQCLTTRVDLNKDHELSKQNLSTELQMELKGLLENSHQNVLYVEIGNVFGQIVEFGPIDGGAT